MRSEASSFRLRPIQAASVDSQGQPVPIPAPGILRTKAGGIRSLRLLNPTDSVQRELLFTPIVRITVTALRLGSGSSQREPVLARDVFALLQAVALAAALRVRTISTEQGACSATA